MCEDLTSFDYFKCSLINLIFPNSIDFELEKKLPDFYMRFM
jgi:hypothetical protein